MRLLKALCGIQAIFASSLAVAAHPGLPLRCKCVPGDKCWPTPQAWCSLNTTLSGALLESHPIASPCYPGPSQDLEACARITALWPTQDFQTSLPLGRAYPYNITCAPVDYASGETPAGDCILGQSPRYAVNATSLAHIRAGLAFAQHHNLRLAVVSTGHDLLGRGDGYGSLELWLRHFRNGISFHPHLSAVSSCQDGWDGAVLRVAGAYQWRDVYAVARANNVIVVGGGSPSVGATGGFVSGGGHGPASRNYGLGADQVLEARVLLASGEVVTANRCQHRDLFRALRGGGPGYGIVLSTIIKAYENVGVVTAHRLAVAPLEATPGNGDLLDAVAVVLRAMPGVNEAGFAGYAYWFRNFPGPFVGNATSGYTHGIWAIGKTREEADAGIAPLRAQLEPFKDRLFVYETFTEYPDYWSFYDAESGLEDPVGDTSLVTSRLFDPASLADAERVRDMVEVISGAPEEYTANVILLVSGGQVFEDAEDELSGLHPAWRSSPFAVVTGRGIPKTASPELRQAVTDDITFVKGAATKELAPDTGGYMNEGNRHDPDYIEAFYGANYASHLKAKRKYDPRSVFYCPTCVGAEAFADSPDGPLCRV